MLGLAPPHTRGSSRHQLPPRHHDPGSPAHAGIVPLGRGSRPVASWLPRTRGDRPWDEDGTNGSHRAPPHTRGSSHVLPRVVEDILRLPRTRGDRPTVQVTSLTSSSAPPHTRGSSHGEVIRGPHVRGSPAHAGIVPSTTRSPTPCLRLPRTRGDRPWTTASIFRSSSAPPHTRGSSRPQSHDPERSLGSPAHAGIVPWRCRPSPARAGLPRTRGDRPFGRSKAERDAATPRTRGDRPHMPYARYFSASAPPHTRGRPQSSSLASGLNMAPPRTRASSHLGRDQD